MNLYHPDTPLNHFEKVMLVLNAYNLPQLHWLTCFTEYLQTTFSLIYWQYEARLGRVEAESTLIIALPGEVIVHTQRFLISTAATQVGGHKMITSAMAEGKSTAAIRPPEQGCLQQAN